MDNIAADAQSLFCSLVGHIRDRIERSLTQSKCVADARAVITQELSETNPALNILRGLETQSRQISYFREHFNFVVSSKHM